jgi:Holliday junction resolvase
MSGKAPRQKGNRFERGIVSDLRAAGLNAFRVPLSGSMRGFKQDVVIRLPDRQLTLEAKCRASGFSFIYNAIKDADLLAIKVDRGEPLLVMRLKDAAAILGQSVKVESQASAPTTTKANKQTHEDTSLDKSLDQVQSSRYIQVGDAQWTIIDAVECD